MGGFRIVSVPPIRFIQRGRGERCVCRGCEPPPPEAPRGLLGRNQTRGISIKVDQFDKFDKDKTERTVPATYARLFVGDWLKIRGTDGGGVTIFVVGFEVVEVVIVAVLPVQRFFVLVVLEGGFGRNVTDVIEYGKDIALDERSALACVS